MIKGLTDKHLSIWWETSAILHMKNEKVSFLNKLRNEKKMENFRKQLFNILKKTPKNEVEEEDLRKEIFGQIKSMELNMSNYKESIIDFFIESGVCKYY